MLYKNSLEIHTKKREREKERKREREREQSKKVQDFARIGTLKSRLEGYRFLIKAMALEGKGKKRKKGI